MSKILSNYVIATAQQKQSLLSKGAATLNLIRCTSTGKVDSQQAQAKAAAPTPKKEAKPVESTSFVMNLFRGKVTSNEILPFPNVLTDDENDMLRSLVDPVAKFLEEKNDALHNDQLEKVPDDIMAGLKELGAFGLQVPAEYNGLELNNTQYARLTEIVGGHDLGIGITIGAHQSIGFKGILQVGTPEQKQKYLPRLATGEDIAAFALTEPASGSDAASIKTRAVLQPDGSYKLTGGKIWISNGGFAEVFTVFAKTAVTDESTGETKDKITAFIVERKFGGVSNGPPEKKMGIKASNTAEVYFEDTPVPAENVLGGVGNGFKVAMNILNAGRFGMAAALSGTMKYSIQKALEFATQRNQFGKHIIHYGAIQEKLARMAMVQYVTESMAYMLSNNMDRNSPEFQLEAAISKIYAAESAWFVTDEAIQVLGGMGFMKSSGLERVLRDLRIFRIFEGSNDILRIFVALTGMNYAGKHLKELQKKVQSFDFGVILNEGKKRIGSKVGMQSLPPVDPNIASQLTPSALLATKAVADFGQVVERVLVKHGRKIVDEQFVTNRIAQATIDIYGMYVVLSRASQSINKNLPSKDHEANLATLFCNEASLRVTENLRLALDSGYAENSKLMTKIAQDMAQHGKTVPQHPLGY